MQIGLVSDTHGIFDRKLVELFSGCQLILHAGDVVRSSVLESLAKVAPIQAVRGNNDFAPPLDQLPETTMVSLGELQALMIHDAGASRHPSPPLRRALAQHRPHLVIHGHSHRPGRTFFDGVLWVNPGAAGPRRFSLPRTAALMEVVQRTVKVDFFDLGGDSAVLWGETYQVQVP